MRSRTSLELMGANGTHRHTSGRLRYATMSSRSSSASGRRSSRAVRIGYATVPLNAGLRVPPRSLHHHPRAPARVGLTLTLGEAADLPGNCHVDEERARGSD